MIDENNDMIYNVGDDMDDADELDNQADADGSDTGLRYDSDEDDLPYAYGRCEDPDETDASAREKSVSVWRLLFGCMFWPVTGWRDLKRARKSVDSVVISCFGPLCLLAALSPFAGMFYRGDESPATLAVRAIMLLLSYMFSYFLIPVVGRPFLGAKVSESLATQFGKNALLTLLSTLVMFKLVSNLLPGLEPVLVFLPLWTIYMIYRLTPMLKAPKDRMMLVTVILSILVLGMPLVCQWGLDLFL